MPLESGDALLTEEVRLKVGLITLAGRGRELYLRHFPNWHFRRLACADRACGPHCRPAQDRRPCGVSRRRARRSVRAAFPVRALDAAPFPLNGMLAARAQVFEILLVSSLSWTK
ncbi:MAG: hypothetical protein U1E97_02480 [Alphaproteobacteria bacterium]